MDFEDEDEYYQKEQQDIDYGFDSIEDYENNEDNIDEEIEEKSVNVLKGLSKGKRNMYFDEEYVKDLIVNKYQPFLDYGIDEKGKKVCVSRERVSKEVEKEIMGNLLLIANAIINKYRYWQFEPIEDLQSEALQAMWKYLPKFTPGKGSAFDLFSIISKRHLLGYTLKNYKHRITGDIDICFDVSTPDVVNYNLFFEDLERVFLNIINRHYLRDQRKKYIELTSILMEYLDKNKKVVGKNDLLSAFKEYGYKSTEYKKFIEEMSKYKEEFYALVAK